MKKILLASVATLGLAGTASAADLAVKAPIIAPVPVYSWTGIYLGLSGGAGSGTKNYRFDQDAALAAVQNPTLPSVFGPSDSSHEVNGGFFGGQLGANWQAGWAVFGIQADWYWANIEGSGSTGPNWLHPRVHARFHAKVKSFGSATGRLGAAFDRVLVYAKAGVAWEQADYEVTAHGRDINDCSNTNNSCNQTQTVGQTRTGFTFGTGVELAFDRNWSAFLEYNYYDFGTEAVNVAFGNTTFSGSPTFTLPFNMEVTEYLHTIKAGINYKLNWWDAPVAAVGPAGTASAADLAVKAPIVAPVPVYSWTGIYLGLGGGAGSGTKNYRFDRDAALAAMPRQTFGSFGPADSSYEVNGGFFGGQLGANWQAGWAVFGIQADWYWADLEGSGSSAPSFRFTRSADARFHAKVKSFGSVTGRLGAAFDRLLVYAKAGVAWEEADYEATAFGTFINDCFNTSNCSQTQTVGQTRTGFTFGTGVELAFDHNWSAFIEYNYYDFGTEAVNYAFSNTILRPFPFFTLPYNLEVTEYLHTVKAGINYKVNWWGAPVAALGPAGTASAADLAVKAPMVAPVPVYSWNGIYLGLSGGAGSGTKNYRFDQDAAGAVPPAAGIVSPFGPADSSYEVNGGFFGGQLGANWQAGWAVFGVQADWYWADLEGSGSSAPYVLARSADARLHAKVKSFGSVTGRLGAAFDRVLVYAKAGVAWKEADYEATASGLYIDSCENDLNCSLTQSVGQTRTGFTFGTGLELAFDHNWSAFIEYNYYDFGTEAVNYAFAAMDSPFRFTIPYNFEVAEYLHTIKAGINYKLNWWDVPVVARY